MVRWNKSRVMINILTRMMLLSRMALILLLQEGINVRLFVRWVTGRWVVILLTLSFLFKLLIFSWFLRQSTTFTFKINFSSHLLLIQSWCVMKWLRRCICESRRRLRIIKGLWCMWCCHLFLDFLGIWRWRTVCCWENRCSGNMILYAGGRIRFGRNYWTILMIQADIFSFWDFERMEDSMLTPFLRLKSFMFILK